MNLRPSPDHAGTDTINEAFDILEQERREKAAPVLAEFKRLGDKASYHFADDSTSEWDKADKAKAEALAIFDAHPELEAQFREVGLGFLWLLGMERPRKGSQP